MVQAKASGIDAFALNIGTDSFTDDQLQYAYVSADRNGMKVFLSFDFNYWSVDDVAAIGGKIDQYAALPAQLKVEGKPFVSTFIGDGLDVDALRAAVSEDIYFAPNFNPGLGTSLASCDGAFNWMAWPNNGANRAPEPGHNDTVQAGDQLYISALRGKAYLAPVSPWFFTHYSSASYSKNWLFPADLLWFTRWIELLTLGPRFVEIISWNDFGESNYVGPLNTTYVRDESYLWTKDMPHGGWLAVAKPFITAFKAGARTVDDFIETDQLVYWYRTQSKDVNCHSTDNCMTGIPGGNYYIGRPDGYETVEDSIFVIALLTAAGTMQVTSGNCSHNFDAEAGASSFSVPMEIGKQSFALVRDSQVVFSGTGERDVLGEDGCGIYNFNAFVGVLPQNEC